MNSFIGFESMYAGNNPNYTRAWLADYSPYFLIGAGAVILPGITIGDYATVGAGSIVTNDIASGITVLGNPARVV
jgi:hypothetical protein